MTSSLITLAERLLYAVKTQQPKQELLAELANFKLSDLTEQLTDDIAKKAFWINIYNAFYQILAQEQQLKHPAIFKQPALVGQDFSLSLDDIEHGILRRFRWKLSLGYLPNLFASSSILQLAVEQIDYRIHFALNCGAQSCPPIAFYRLAQLEAQLQLATQSFVSSETTLDQQRKQIHTSALFSWFRADFGGPRAIKRLIGEVLKEDLHDYKLRYTTYNWTSQLNNFAD